jgi:hypothetical protein
MSYIRFWPKPTFGFRPLLGEVWLDLPKPEYAPQYSLPPVVPIGDTICTCMGTGRAQGSFLQACGEAKFSLTVSKTDVFRRNEEVAVGSARECGI